MGYYNEDGIWVDDKPVDRTERKATEVLVEMAGDLYDENKKLRQELKEAEARMQCLKDQRESAIREQNYFRDRYTTIDQSYIAQENEIQRLRTELAAFKLKDAKPEEVAIGHTVNTGWGDPLELVDPMGYTAEKIPTIRKAREVYGIGLKEAKDLVDGWAEQGRITFLGQKPKPEPSDEGTGPDRYPSVVRDSSGYPVDVS